MASTLSQLSSHGQGISPGGSSVNVGGNAGVPAWLPNNALAVVATNTTPPYNGTGAPNFGVQLPYLRFQKLSGAFANGDFIDDLVMPQGMGFPGLWVIYDYTANATPALPAPVVLGQVGQDATFALSGAGNVSATQSISSGLASTQPASSISTPPYIVNNQAAPFLRFSQQQALATNQIVVDLVMPQGHQVPSAFYVVRYTLNASLQLT